MALLTRTGLRINRYCSLADFPFFKMPSMDFKKFEISTARTLLRVKMRHHAKFREVRSNRFGDMADFRFSRWRPSAILDFQKLKILTSGPVRRANLRHRSKFYEDWLNRSRDMADFCVFDLLCLFQFSVLSQETGWEERL